MFPTAWTVDVVTPTTGAGYDDLGNPIPGTPRTRTERVYGWAPAAGGQPNSESGTTWQHQVEHDLDLYAPPAFTVGPSEKVVVLARTYEVVGEVEDYSHGPFGFAPGVRVNLKRVSG